MKNLIALFLTSLLLLSSAQAVENNVSTKVESVTIYHSGALVSRVGTVDLKPGINELVFKNLSSKIVLNSLKIGNKQVTILNKSIIRKLTKEEFSQLLDKKEALNKQMNLIEAKYSEAGFVSKVEDLEKMSSFYSNKTQQIKRELREIESAIIDAKKVENIQLNNENAAILKLNVSVEGKLNQPLKLQYVCGGIGWSPSYDIIVKSSADKIIEFKYLARVMSQTGEDWDNVTVNLSSSFPLESPTELPKADEAWVIDRRSAGNMKPPVEAEDNKAAQESQIDQLEGVQYEEINIPSFLKWRTLKNKYSIKSNSTVFTFPIQKVSLASNYYYYAYPSIDAEVYLVAQVTGWDTLHFVDGIANVSFNGTDVGKSVIKFSESKDTLVLPVGKDNSVYLKRSEMNDQKYFKVAKVGKKRESTMAYKFELKNNNSFPIQFELVDQIPISQMKSAKVQLLTSSQGKVNNEIGEVNWSLNLKPGQKVDKKLIFKIEMEGSYSSSFRFLQKNRRSRPKFNSRYAPKF